MTDESDFIDLLIANQRVAEWLKVLDFDESAAR
jgi:hypothetical protein